MKKILKKEVIIAFIIGIILASSIAVYAYSYAAKDVSYTKPGTDTAISVETALNDLYSKQQTSSSSFTGNFYLSAVAEQNGYTSSGSTSYFDIDVSNYNKITFNISGLFTSKTSVFTSYILADGTNIKNITQTGEFEINTSSVSTIRVYYHENEGYYFISGTYTLSK